jgi:hypothetical protein
VTAAVWLLNQEGVDLGSIEWVEGAVEYPATVWEADGVAASETGEDHAEYRPRRGRVVTCSLMGRSM